GAVVPAGIERIIRFEYAEAAPTDEAQSAKTPPRVRVAVPEASTNIALPGENIRSGEELLSPRRLTAVDVGILASQGYRRIPVVRRPAVAIFSTGSELYSPAEELPPPWAIYDSNGYQLAALARSNLASVRNYGILEDKQAVITRAIRDAVQESDVVIVSGGVSMGDLDYVPAALADIGATRLFHGLAMKPGKPTLFATLREKLLFGLPGNPVSTVAQFEFFIAPALYALQGLDYRPREGRFPLASSYTRAKADRHEFRPGYYRDGLVHQITYQGSGHLSALASADLIFRIDRGVEALSEGDTVYARFIRPDDRLSSDLGNR
ncbi:MAG: molybdopterin molybdotransferase MoeA, partial [Spirochaetales bacterium]|nr:molybdopterin molybdotransferase MoeA [Spirochaetales bacterium]